MTRHDLTRAQVDHSQTSRSCAWTTARFSTMVLIRWDSRSLVDFSQAFPVPGEDGVELGGVRVFVGQSDVRPACAAFFFAERGTIVEVVVGDEPPSTADAACERVETVGTAVVRELRDLKLLDAVPTAAPTATS